MTREQDLDCGSNSCRFGGRYKGGMRTNGRCTCIENLIENVKEQRALIEQQAKELAELREWKRIILGTGTDQEAVIRLAATEYTKVAIQTWKAANAEQRQEIARLREALTVSHAALVRVRPQAKGALVVQDIDIAVREANEALIEEHT